MGRETDLQRLHEYLQQSDRVAITAIRGMGGVGKTELALQYAYRSLEQQTYAGGICWLRVGETIGSELVQFARAQLDLPVPEGLDLSGQVQWCWRHWRSGQVLIVFDDLTEDAIARPYLPPADDRFKVLTTTRVQLGASFRELLLEVLSEDAALDLLRSIVTTERIDSQLTDAAALCDWLGYLPLGLELVARYLEQKPDLSLADLRKRLAAKRLEAIALQQAYLGMTAPLGVAAAFELSWQTLDEAAQTIAYWLSLFAIAPIAWAWVQACLPDWDEEAAEAARDQLVRSHLLQYPAPHQYQLHPLVREFFAAKRSGMAIEEEMKRSVCRVLVSEAKQIPQALTLTLVAQFTPLIPHIAKVATHLIDWITDNDLIEPYTRIAWFYQGQALYEQAQLWLEHCQIVAADRLSADHPNVATSLNNLASIYKLRGYYGKANLLLIRSLSIREEKLGTEHIHVAQSLNNLAELYRSQGQYEQAEAHLLRSRSIYAQQLGTTHSDMATCLNNLALIYETQGRYGEAESFFVESLSIYTKQFGSTHLSVATSFNNLAELHRLQGRHVEAESLHKQALSIREQNLGRDHIDLGQSYNNLAAVYASQGRYTEAESLYIRSLTIHEHCLGQMHPAVATSLNNLATMYPPQGRYEEAERLLLRALSIMEQQLGVTHPDVAQSLNNLGELYRLQERYSESKIFHLRALEIRKSQLGKTHLSVAQSLNNLAMLYHSQECYPEAEVLYKQSLIVIKQRLNRTHPDVAGGLHNLAAIYVSQGRYAKAECHYLQSLTILFKQLGEEHLITQTVWQNFADFLQQTIASDQTAQLSDHPVTQDLLRDLRNGE